jgi:DNA-binding transcriptional LysR family regulator
MDINKLQHFRVVYETVNIRQASELLSMTAGALSKSMRIFQEELDIELIESQGRGIVITEAGRILYQKSNRLIEELNQLNRNLNTPIQDQIKFGTYEVFSTHFLSQFLLSENIPNISCVELAPGMIENSLLKREIDFGLNIVPFPHEDLDHLVIGKTTLKTYCTKKSKYLNYKKEDLEFTVPITQLESNPTKSTVIDSWPDNIQRKIKYQFNMLETALQVVSNDQSVIYCPEISVINYNKNIKPSMKLIEHPYKRANKVMNIYLVKRKETAENNFSKKLAKFIRMNNSFNS